MPGLSYLGVPITRPRVAFFDFTGCEGCQLQVLNDESRLLEFLSLVEVVRFREAMTGGTDDYEIAFVEGSITRDDEIERLKHIRERAALVVAFGSCACFGGVNQLKNRLPDMDAACRAVYGGAAISSRRAGPLSEHIKVDLNVYGCPVSKPELERTVLGLILGKDVRPPVYPVCMECKEADNTCLFELGEVCLGPVTRAGCGAWCPSGSRGCWGCRGPAEDCNLAQLLETVKSRGLSVEALMDRLECFGGFAGRMAEMREKAAPAMEASR